MSSRIVAELFVRFNAKARQVGSHTSWDAVRGTRCSFPVIEDLENGMVIETGWQW